MRRIFFNRILLIGWINVLCTLSAARVAASNLDIQLLSERQVIAQTGSGAANQFESATQVRLGEQVFYTLLVRNVSSEPIQTPTIEHALPRNTRYVLGSAAGPAAEVSVSVDGGANFGELRDLQVATAVGQTRSAEAADCTHIRWKLRHPLMPGAVAKLRFRAEFH